MPNRVRVAFVVLYAFDLKQAFLLGVYECVMGSGLLQRTFSGVLLPAGFPAVLADALSGH